MTCAALCLLSAIFYVKRREPFLGGDRGCALHHGCHRKKCWSVGIQVSSSSENLFSQDTKQMFGEAGTAGSGTLSLCSSNKTDQREQTNLSGSLVSVVLVQTVFSDWACVCLSERTTRRWRRCCSRWFYFQKASTWQFVTRASSWSERWVRSWTETQDFLVWSHKLK